MSYCMERLSVKLKATVYKIYVRLAILFRREVWYLGKKLDGNFAKNV